jgi:rSAM/selenodomain-associated transferase 1
MSPRRLTAIFAKRPLAGAVKTRLSPPLAPEEAAELAAAMLDDTLAACRGVSGHATLLRVAPAAELGWFRARYPGVTVVAQEGDGLGARLAAHFAAEHAARPGWTFVVLGSDAPHLGAARALEAHERLERGAELVLGPDEGGGYHLVGLRRSVPELFTRVPMSCAETFGRTLALARSLGLAVEQTESGYDVDLPADLARLARELRARDATSAGFPRRTARLLARLLPDPTPR